jgi:hypothetical protein
MRCLAALLLALIALPAAADDPQLEHPMSPSFVSLRGGKTRRVLFEARWHGSTGPADPTSEGATLRIVGGEGQGDSGLVVLGADHWKMHGRLMRYTDPAGSVAGIRSVVIRILKKGGVVRVAGHGAWPYTVDQPQTAITVTLGVGASRWCASFDGANLKNGPKRVEGHSKSAPQSCPCEAPAASTFAAIQTAIFERHGCTQDVCHGASPGQGNLDLLPDVAWAQLVDQPSTILPSQNRVQPGAKDTSLLYRKLAAYTLGLQGVPGARMPNGDFAPLTPNELRAVELWIYNGAPKTGVIKGTDALLASCLPPATPQKIPPPNPPAAGEGVQLYSPPWTIPPHGEGEVCFASYYDFTSQVPPELTFPCPDAWGGPGKSCFGYKRTEITQDPNSHHSIPRIYRGTYPITDPGWGTFTCHGGANAGMACDPQGLGTPAPAGAECGERSGCAGTVVPAVACTFYGPPDFSAGFSLTQSQAAPQILVSTTPYYVQNYPGGVYNVMPVKGIFVENSHAFNTTDEPTTNEEWLNVYFASSAERQYVLHDLVDIADIFIEDVPPFATAEYCRTFTPAIGTRLFELYSHTHKRGKLYRAWGPGVWPPCSSSQGPCAPETGEPFLVTTDYAAPDTVLWNPVLPLDGGAQSRTFKYCAEYDNGASDPSTVKRYSTSPPAEFGAGGCTLAETACLAGPKKGQPCNGNNALCDSHVGLGDGICDACPVHGGVTTDDEMFLMLGSYYCEHGTDCEAQSTP